MMIATLLDDQDKISARAHIAFANNVGILISRDRPICIRANVNNRDVRGGNRRKDIDGVTGSRNRVP
jgi:hypothetical protein